MSMLSGLFERAKGKGSADEVEVDETVLVVKLEVVEELGDEDDDEVEGLVVEEEVAEVLVVDVL
jgi:hypothetical protein